MTTVVWLAAECDPDVSIKDQSTSMDGLQLIRFAAQALHSYYRSRVLLVPGTCTYCSIVHSMLEYYLVSRLQYKGTSIM